MLFFFVAVDERCYGLIGPKLGFYKKSPHSEGVNEGFTDGVTSLELGLQRSRANNLENKIYSKQRPVL